MHTKMLLTACRWVANFTLQSVVGFGETEWLLQSSGLHSCFTSGRSWVQILVQRLGTLKIYVVLLSLSRHMSNWYLKLGYKNSTIKTLNLTCYATIHENFWAFPIEIKNYFGSYFKLQMDKGHIRKELLLEMWSQLSRIQTGNAVQQAAWDD